MPFSIHGGGGKGHSDLAIAKLCHGAQIMEMYTAYDLSGETIIPFVTSGGSGFSDTIRTIKSMEPDAEVLDGLSSGSPQAAEPVSAVIKWLNGIAE